MTDKPAAGSASKSDAQKQEAAAAAKDPKAAATAAPAKLEHGEPGPQQENEAKQAEETQQDPWGETPLQMRDTHSEEVDPQKVGTVAGSVKPGVRGAKLDAMEPGNEGTDDGAKMAGTNAPA